MLACVRCVCEGLRTGRVDRNVNVWAQRAVPPIDGEDDPEGVDVAGERDGALGEGRDAAVGVGEGGVAEEVGIEGGLLLVWAAGGEGSDYVANLSD